MRKDGRRIIVILSLIIYDVLAVNISYLMALFVRFYANGVFHSSAETYLPQIWRFAPFYTVACVVVFSVFKLYNLVWRFVGNNDIKTIFVANVITCGIQIFGTLIFVTRMPITYYIFGAFFQLLMTTVIRVIPRIIYTSDSFEGMYPGEKSENLSIMIVGIRENAHILQDHISKSKKNMNRVVCLLDYEKQAGTGRTFNGVPVVSGVEHMRKAVKEYHVDCVIITDIDVPGDIYSEIKAVCEESNIEMRKFFIGTDHIYSRISLPELMNISSGPVILLKEGTSFSYSNGREAAKAVSNLSYVSDVKAESGALFVTLGNASSHDTSDDAWKENYKKENNEELSFF